MPRQPKAAPTTLRNGNIQFVEPMLDSTQKARLVEWDSVIAGDDLLNLMGEMLADGYNISIKKTDTGGQCSVIPAGDDHKDSGKMLVCRGSTPMKALRVAVFKYTYVLAGEWPDAPRSAFDL